MGLSNNDAFVKFQVKKAANLRFFLRLGGGQLALKLSSLQITGYSQSNENPSKYHSITHRIKSRTKNHIKRINLLHSLISPYKVSGGLIGAVPIRIVFTVLVFGPF